MTLRIHMQIVYDFEHAQQTRDDRHQNQTVTV